MYFLFAIPVIAIAVIIVAEFHGLTKAFRPAAKAEVSSNDLADALIEHMLETDHSRQSTAL
jgi:hypothetical protein